MKKATARSGLSIGTIFTIVSALSSFTYVVPVIAVLPGILFENISQQLVNNEPYSNVGKMTIFLLTVLFIVTLALSLTWTKNNTASQGYISKLSIVIMLLVMYFIVHPLGLYIYWGLAQDFESDGQLILISFFTVPLTSICFVLIGLLIDWAKSKGASIWDKTNKPVGTTE